MRSLVIGAILTAALMTACGGPQGVAFSATLSNPNGEFPLPVTLNDITGLVVGIGPTQMDFAGFRDAGILPDPSGEIGFIITWLGGMCDSDAALAFSSTSSGYDLHLAIHGKLGLGGCPAAGILRALRIEASKAIPVGTIAISGSKTIELVLDEDCGPLTAAETNDAKIACGSFIEATIGDRTTEFSTVTVAPADGPCAGTECSTTQGIANRNWRVDALARNGERHTWRCTYRDETASCVAESLVP